MCLYKALVHQSRNLCLTQYYLGWESHLKLISDMSSGVNDRITCKQCDCRTTNASNVCRCPEVKLEAIRLIDSSSFVWEKKEWVKIIRMLWGCLQLNFMQHDENAQVNENIYSSFFWCALPVPQRCGFEESGNLLFSNTFEPPMSNWYAKYKAELD